MNTTISNDTCLVWKESQHVLYQLGNLGFAIAFLVPCVYRGHDSLLRGLVCCAAIFVVAWGASVASHTLAICAWHISFLLVNVMQLLYTAFRFYPGHLDKDLEALYVDLFQPLMIMRKDFVQLARLGNISIIPSGANFATQGNSYNDTLSVLLSGRLSVLQGDACLHSIESSQFVDSIEFEAASQFDSRHYQVSYKADVDCRVLTWQRETITKHMQNKPDLAHRFTVLLGNDVYYKILKVHASRVHNDRYSSFLRQNKGKYFSYGTAT